MEDPAVGVEGDHTFLNPGPGAVVEADHRHPGRRRQIHHLVDLLGEHLPEGPPEHREVLAEDADPAAVDGAEPGDHPVGIGPVLVQPHAVRPVPGQHVQLLEGTVVEEVLDPLPGGHLALGMVTLHRGLAAGVPGLLLAFRQLRQPLSHRMFHEQAG